MKYFNNILFCLLILLGPASEFAVANSNLHIYQASISYRVGQYNYDPSYLDNAAVATKLYQSIEEIGLERIDSVQIFSYASPEGTLAQNISLAQKRAIDSKWLIVKKFPSLSKLIRIENKGEDWEGLREYISSDSQLTELSKIDLLKILDAPISTEAKKARLKSIGGDANVGNVYRYIINNYYSKLRSTTLLVFYIKPVSSTDKMGHKEEESVEIEPNQASQEAVDEIESKITDSTQEDEYQNDIQSEQSAESTQAEAIPEPQEQKQIKLVKPKENFIGLKTNLLYDALTMLNAEVEIPFARRFSVMVEGVFPWWEFVPNKYALQNTELGLETRFWFKPWEHDRNKMLGWFIGPYLMSGKCDFQFDTSLCYQATYLSSGLTAGLAIPLGKKKGSRWANLEFSLSFGYLSANYQHYQPSGDYSSLIRDDSPTGSGNVSYIGPTKAKISLVIPINFHTSKTIVSK